MFRISKFMREIATPGATPPRSGAPPGDLRHPARSLADAKQARLTLALSLGYNGASRSEAARHDKASLQPTPPLSSIKPDGNSLRLSGCMKNPQAGIANAILSNIPRADR
jgi:hypothetical protein